MRYYSREEVERLIATWDTGVTWANVEARADFSRARATLSEPQRIVLHYLCYGYSPKDIAALTGQSLPIIRALLKSTVTRLIESLNQPGQRPAWKKPEKPEKQEQH